MKSIIDHETEKILKALEDYGTKPTEGDIIHFHGAQLRATVSLIRIIDRFNNSSSKTVWAATGISIFAAAIIAFTSIQYENRLKEQRKILEGLTMEYKEAAKNWITTLNEFGKLNHPMNDTSQTGTKRKNSQQQEITQDHQNKIDKP